MKAMTLNELHATDRLTKCLREVDSAKLRNRYIKCKHRLQKAHIEARLAPNSSVQIARYMRWTFALTFHEQELFARADALESIQQRQMLAWAHA